MHKHTFIQRKMCTRANLVTLSLVTTLVALIITPSNLVVQCCPSSEWASLMAIKASLYEPNFGIFHTWRGTNCCYKWYGISCDPTTRRVAEINLNGLTVPDNRRRLNRHATTGYMTGHISPSICNLTQLSSITISDWKGISGIIPSCIQSFSLLQILDLSGNSITGEVPRSIGSLTQLTMLNLADNRISGTIPTTLTNLNNLVRLDLRNNLMRGHIPKDLGRLKKLNRAFLSHNLLTGPIPETVSEIYGLAVLDLSMNRLFGPIHTSLGRMPVLDSLKLKYNRLTGEIPSTVLGSRMTHLDLRGNLLSGEIADVFGERSYFINLDLSFNNLSGLVPKSLRSANYIGHLDLSHNRLCGKIPIGKPFDRLKTTSFEHNKCLCGMPLKPCTQEIV